MTNLIVSWVLYAVALYATANLVPGISIRKGADGLVDVFVGSLILVAVKTVIQPVIVLLTLPITILTLGLFYFVIFGITFWLMTLVVPGIKVHGFFPCIVGGIVFAFLSWILHLAHRIL